MLIKYQNLSNALKTTQAKFFVIAGNEPFLIDAAANQIKAVLPSELDKQVLQLDAAADWELLTTAASSYSMFYDYTLLDVTSTQKSIPVAGKKVIEQILHETIQNIIILRLPNVSAKSLSWLSNHKQVLFIQIYPFNERERQQWIQQEFAPLKLAPQVPALINRFTRGNLFACKQIIDIARLVLTDQNTLITEAIITPYLTDQCTFSLYDLGDACLNGDIADAIKILRTITRERMESTLILWILLQEIRLLLQLDYMTQQQIPFTTACQQLKIFSFKTSLYQKALQRLSKSQLITMLQKARELDLLIKTGNNRMLLCAVERLIVTFGGSSLLAA